ncbi:MAG TPA: trimethylamine--corrinoid methyltransferase [Acetomicrobium flavidum]|uniref:Uncharacterized protein n=1 Tax=Acetomicrobium mobile (strain ATCC BAA-54 / DSM 13181 / JCM 12221 / NGA) TaxID=891968 RepID=I4BTY5_ACEMN|nr:trimethylamine--corrinoid methyltransferase [Acetomicrobium mobile]HOJ82332.1 trimethylamine--corrinoid methyltransferase [Acetomicrobium flavidum]AFM20742.1 hypothetical protein Anamo_0069 [Acetomicrobium mobile DSM 13181]HOM31336.1 trimethylamine--corrinoid methyltransferase [Acetomicrobium flavidum]HOP87533.1 trimethylamine--corrinoid methyltransferase [Acetomicrobium flavidum]HPP14162.1 trimethylamine--corrinoid methyltransferase [Acetomicrobium flavidum]
MAYHGPSGLIGRPARGEEKDFVPYEVEGVGDITCWIHKDALEHLKNVSPTREGDYLLACEEAGRIRFKLL